MAFFSGAFPKPSCHAFTIKLKKFPDFPLPSVNYGFFTFSSVLFPVALYPAKGYVPGHMCKKWRKINKLARELEGKLWEEGEELNLYNLEKEKALEERDGVSLHRSNINEGRELLIVSEDGRTEGLAPSRGCGRGSLVDLEAGHRGSSRRDHGPSLPGPVRWTWASSNVRWSAEQRHVQLSHPQLPPGLGATPALLGTVGSRAEGLIFFFCPQCGQTAFESKELNLPP